MDRLAKLFVLNRAGLNLKRGAVVFGGMLVPFVVLTALDQQQYFLPAAFATLFAAMCDPGGEYRTRVQMMAGMAVAGALLTGLGFAVGARGWGLVVLAAFVVTLAAGLMVKFGGHRFFAAVLLNPSGTHRTLNPVTNRRTINTSEGGSRPPTAPRTAYLSSKRRESRPASAATDRIREQP